MEPWKCDLCGKDTPGYLAGPKHSKMEVNGKTIAIVCAECQSQDRPKDFKLWAGVQEVRDGWKNGGTGGTGATSSGIAPEHMLSAFNLLVWLIGIFVVAGRQTYKHWDLPGYGTNGFMMFVFALVGSFAVFGLIPLLFYGLIVKRSIAMEVCWIPIGLYFLFGAIFE